MKIIVYLFLLTLLVLTGCSNNETLSGKKKYFPNEKAYELHQVKEELKSMN